METYKEREDLIIMFTDSYDVVLLAEPETILAETGNNFGGILQNEGQCCIWCRALLLA